MSPLKTIRNAGALLLLAVPPMGCTRYIAARLVEAPNRALPAAERTDAPPEELKRLYIDRQLRVPVGSPEDRVSLSVWISEPSRDLTNIGFEVDGMQSEVHITRRPNPSPPDPATQPAWPLGTLVFIHGIQDRKEFAPYLLYREVFVHAGYRVVQVDLRGHGRSTGDLITWGASERTDLVEVLNTLDREGHVTGPVGVIGISYGAAVAIQWAAVDPRIRAVVAIAPFTSMEQVAQDGAPFVLGGWRHFFTREDIARAVKIAGQIASFDPASIRPIDSITQTKAPVLLIHARHDQLIPFAHSEQLHAAARSHSRLLPIEQGTHFDLWYTSFNIVRAASLSWFNARLQEKAGTSPLLDNLPQNPATATRSPRNPGAEGAEE